MMRIPWIDQLSKGLIRLLTFTLIMLCWLLAEILSGWQIIHSAFWLMAVGFSLIAAWLAGDLVASLRDQRQIKEQIIKQVTRTNEIQRRLESMVHLNRQLIEVEDEQSLVEKALGIVTDLTGALASSFVPLDEMGEPLSAIVQGSLPEPILKAWSEHLASQLVRKTCGKCQELHADAGQVCPLLVGPFADAFSVYCLPLQRGERTYGLMNVYFGSGHALNPETRAFLEGILAEMGNALQTVRLRQQELATLRQLQLARANRHDLGIALSELLENLRKTFEMDSAWLHTRAIQEGQPELDIRRGDPTWPESGGPQAVFQQTIQTGKALEGMDSPDGEVSPAINIQSAPLVLPDGMVIGAILLGSDHPKPQKSSQQAEVLKTVATQAALLIGSERTRELLEYTIVIQERNRLAREIHDGLAQTLAYLKLQTAQMQRALVQNDLPMLKDLLNQNYSSLADAYLDARQAIDNLRLNPQHGMDHWLDQTVKEFENLSGVPVHRCFDKLTIELPSEVQVQLVRIVQEVFSNIRKHARANHAWINVKEWGSERGGIILEVGDDGQGFQADDVPGLAQYELRGMRERAELIGADFQIASRPGEGTVVCMRLPAQSWEVNG